MVEKIPNIDRNVSLSMPNMDNTIRQDELFSLQNEAGYSTVNKVQDPILQSVLVEFPQPVRTNEYSLQLPVDRSVVEMAIKTRHQKDVSIARVNDRYYMISSATGVDDQSDWKMRSYTSSKIEGPWESNGIVTIEGEESPRMCAAGVVKDDKYRMLVQTECFAEGGTIEYAESEDGSHYSKRRTVLESIPGTEFAGIYDSEPTVVENTDGTEELYVTFTGVRRYESGSAKDGAIYLARARSGWDGAWEVIQKPLFTEYSIPPHIPTLEGGEWVPEGGKALQITGRNNEQHILFYGTCFIEGEWETRQRGFLAMADTIDGEYTFLGLLEPKDCMPGETGHGTIVEEKDPNGLIEDDILHIVHQARDKGPGLWRTERASYRKEDILDLYAQKRSAQISFSAD